MEKSFEDLKFMLDANYPLIYLASPEYGRIIQKVRSIAYRKGYNFYTWDQVDGLQAHQKKEGTNSLEKIMKHKNHGETESLDALLEFLLKGNDENGEQKEIFILEDAHKQFSDEKFIVQLRKITQYFKANNFKLADSAASADRVVTIYPSVKSIKNKETNDIEYTIGINGYLTTKAKKVKVSSTEDSITLDYKSQVADTQFSAIRLNNTIFAKEKFKFSMGIQVNNAADDKEVAETVADLVVSKLFNVLGLQDTK